MYNWISFFFYFASLSGRKTHSLIRFLFQLLFVYLILTVALSFSTSSAPSFELKWLRSMGKMSRFYAIIALNSPVNWKTSRIPWNVYKSFTVRFNCWIHLRTVHWPELTNLQSELLSIGINFDEIIFGLSNFIFGTYIKQWTVVGVMRCFLRPPLSPSFSLPIFVRRIHWFSSKKWSMWPIHILSAILRWTICEAWIKVMHTYASVICIFAETQMQSLWDRVWGWLTYFYGFLYMFLQPFFHRKFHAIECLTSNRMLIRNGDET